MYVSLSILFVHFWPLVIGGCCFSRNVSYADKMMIKPIVWKIPLNIFMHIYEVS